MSILNLTKTEDIRKNQKLFISINLRTSSERFAFYEDIKDVIVTIKTSNMQIKQIIYDDFHNNKSITEDKFYVSINFEGNINNGVLQIRTTYKGTAEHSFSVMSLGYNYKIYSPDRKDIEDILLLLKNEKLSESYILKKERETMDFPFVTAKTYEELEL